jgi:hypothetical protein
MVVLLLTGFIAVVLAYISTTSKKQNALALAFVLLAGVYAIRDNYGTDFWRYYYHFIEYSGVQNIKDLFAYREGGWAILNWIFRYFNFYVFSAFVGCVINFFVYYFIKTNVPRKWWVLAVFIYVFSPNLYVLSFSMMRQSLAMALFLFSWNYIKQKRIVVSFLILLAAISIHTSAILTLPFIFVGYAKKIKTTGWVTILILLFVFFVFISQNMGEAFELMEGQQRLSHYARDHANRSGSLSFGIGFIMLSIPTIITIYLLSKKKFTSIASTEYREIAIIGAFSTYFSLLGQINSLLMRLGLYFLIYTVGSAPIVFSFIRSQMIRVTLISMFCIGIFYSFILFFSDPAYASMFSEFHTIFE